MRKQDVPLRQGLDIPLYIRAARRQTRVGIADRIEMRQQTAAGSFNDEECKIRDDCRYYWDDLLRCDRSCFTEGVYRDRNVGEQGGAFDGRVQ